MEKAFINFDDCKKSKCLIIKKNKLLISRQFDNHMIHLNKYVKAIFLDRDGTIVEEPGEGGGILKMKL